MSEKEPVRELASSPCQAPPGHWDENGACDNTPCPAIDRLWDRLSRVRVLSFVARSERPGGWNGKGSGTVIVQQTTKGSMTFAESGVWRPEGGNDIRFRNVFRWTIAGETLRLEHLRFGEDHPVYLFDLAPAGEGEWRSVSPHLCSEDRYSARLVVRDDGIVLRWSIDGPRKREEIEYVYSWQDAAS